MYATTQESVHTHDSCIPFGNNSEHRLVQVGKMFKTDVLNGKVPWNKKTPWNWKNFMAKKKSMESDKNFMEQENSMEWKNLMGREILQNGKIPWNATSRTQKYFPTLVIPRQI